MKRSEKYFMRSRHCGWMSAVTLMASVAIVCWAPMSILSGERHPGGMAVAVGMGALALAGMALAIRMAAEAIELSRRANMESRREWEREVRPRI